MEDTKNHTITSMIRNSEMIRWTNIWTRNEIENEMETSVHKRECLHDVIRLNLLHEDYYEYKYPLIVAFRGVQVTIYKNRKIINLRMIFQCLLTLVIFIVNRFNFL